MPALTLDVAVETLRLREPFRISGFVFETSDIVLVTLGDGEHVGRGEAAGAYYLGDDVANIVATLADARETIEAGPTREELRALLPPGGARNAVDCALWELEAARRQWPVWALAGQRDPKPLVTTFTLGADDPDRMAEGARRYAQARAIKAKLTGDLDLDIARVRAIRAARPEVWLGVDGNQGFDVAQLGPLIDALGAERVSLLEQPLARGRDADLEGLHSPIPIAGDESLLTLTDLAVAKGRFDVVNIKLDKCGGLTEGLLMAAAARELGMGVMVGNMIGTSLAMAPAFVLGQLCDYVDLDGPTFLAQDRVPAVTYADGEIWAGPEVWGASAASAA